MSEEVSIKYDNIWYLFGYYMYKDKNFVEFQKKWFLYRYNLTEKKLNELIKDKNVIEIGTGSGAFLKNLIFAKEIYGLDISDIGIKIAEKMYSNQNNVKLIKKDLMSFEGKFDIVIADQVLHHLPNTFKALEKAVNLLKPNGIIMFYIYRKKGPFREFLDTSFRFFTTNIPDIACLEFSKITCLIGRILTKISLRLQRFIYWNFFKCFWNEDFLYENNLRVNYDWYSPPIAHRHTLDEIISWTKILNLKIESLDMGKSGISVRAVKCYP